MEKKPEFKVNNFDLLRLLAATQVVFDHYYQHLGIKLSPLQINLLYLFPGVPVFFFISGYLISASFERNDNLFSYFRNRALRIYPGLWGCILITVIAISATGVSFLNKQTLLWIPLQLIGVIYTPGFLSNYGFGSYNGSLWSIPIELQFYLAIPVLYFIIPQRKFNAFIIIFFVAFLGFNLAFQSITLNERLTKLINYTFAPHFYLFLLGIMLQRFKLFQHRLINSRGGVFLTGYLLFCLLTYRILPPLAFEVIRNILLGFVVLALAYSWPQTARKLLRGNDVSYGIYIYHGLILTVLVQLNLAQRAGLITLLLSTFFMAALSWWFFERPFIRMKKKAMQPLK